jgi:phosphomethylpyrimidine synthase
MTVRTFLSRRNFSEGGCSMKITEDFRRYAAEQGVTEDQAVKRGLEEKTVEFARAGGDLYKKI